MRFISRVIVMLTVVAVAALPAPPADTLAKSVKVGAAINLTGPASTFGQYHAKGLQDYFKYVNEVKGGVYGHTLELIMVDTAYKVPEAIAAVRKFAVRDRVNMIATWSAGEGLAAKPIVQRDKIPTINFSTSWEILKPPIDYFYLPFGSYRLDCYAILDYIRKIHAQDTPPKIGLLTYNNAYGRSIHQPSREYAEKHNIEIVAIEEFPAKTVDLTTELLRLRKKGADYIVLQMLPAAIITTLKCADRINYEPAFFGTWTSTDPDFFAMGKGLIRDRLKIQFSGGLPGDNTEGVKLLQDLWQRYHTVETFDASYWEGVVIAMIMERAFQRSYEKSKKITRETINDALESMNDEDMGGLVPNISYSKENHEGSFKARLVSVHEDGTFTPLTLFFIPGKEEITLIQN